MKKRFICIISVFVFVFCMVPVFSSAATKGDVNGDSDITAADARLALRYSVGLEIFSEGQRKAADMDGDDKITAGDARTILRLSVGLTDDGDNKDQVEILRSGNFYVKGEMSPDGVNYEKMEIATTERSCYMLSDFDGAEMGMLIDENELYMVYPEKKAALHMSESLLGMMGMSKEELISSSDFDFSSTPPLKEMKKERTEKFRNMDCTVYSYEIGAEKYEIYMCEDSLVRMVSYDRNMRISSDMVISYISDSIPEKCTTVPADYKLYNGISGMFSFMTLLEDVL